MARVPSPPVVTAVLVTFLVVAPVAIDAAAAVDPDDFDRRLDSGDRFWAGQVVYFDGSEVVTNVDTASVDERTFEVQTVTDEGRVGSFVREFVVDTDGERVLDTAGLEQGRYVVLYDGRPVYVQDGTGYKATPPDGTTVTIENSAWSVTVQSITASWSDDRVFRNDVVNLEIESNRVDFLIEVSAAGLDFDDLESMFDPEDFAPDHDAKADDHVLILAVPRDRADLPVRFRDIENGEYTMVVEVADTTARTTTTIRVGRPPAATATGTPIPEGMPTAAPSTTAAPTASPTRTVALTQSPEPTRSPEPPIPAMPTATASPVASPEPTTQTPPSVTPTESPGQPGFGVGLAVVGLLIAVLAIRRRGGSRADP